MYEKERKRLTEELDQYKLQCNNLKIFIEEQGRSTGASTPSKSNPEGGKHPSGSISDREGYVNTTILSQNIDFEGILKKHMNPSNLLESSGLGEIHVSSSNILQLVEKTLHYIDVFPQVIVSREKQHDVFICTAYYVKFFYRALQVKAKKTRKRKRLCTNWTKR